MFKLLALIVIVIKATAPAPESLATPVPYLSQNIQNQFQAPLWDKGPGHRGIDLSVAEGQQIASLFDGEVHFVGKVVNRKVLTLISKTGLKASFEPVCSLLEQNQSVLEGQQIATWCEGDETYLQHCEKCIHFSIRNEYGYLNPLLFYGLLVAPKLIG